MNSESKFCSDFKFGKEKNEFFKKDLTNKKNIISVDLENSYQETEGKE